MADMQGPVGRSPVRTRRFPRPEASGPSMIRWSWSLRCWAVVRDGVSVMAVPSRGFGGWSGPSPPGEAAQTRKKTPPVVGQRPEMSAVHSVTARQDSHHQAWVLPIELTVGDRTRGTVRLSAQRNVHTVGNLRRRTSWKECIEYASNTAGFRALGCPRAPVHCRLW